MRSALGIALRAALFAAFAWFVAVALMLSQRTQLIYRFDALDGDARALRGPGTIADFAAADGTPIVYFDGGGADSSLLIHFGGNAGSLRLAELTTRRFALRAGYRVAVMNYRGAGGQPGRPSEEAILSDALRLYDRLAGETPPVVTGSSLGAAVAVGLAARRPVRALVLRSPFAELCSVAEHHYPWLPACLVMWDERWDSLSRIGEIDAPILILHGARDSVVPLPEARRLAEAAQDARLVVLPEAGHDTLWRHGGDEEILAFLRAL